MISNECLGASIAVLLPVAESHSYDVVAIQRDTTEGIAYPGMWEFPGGGVEVDDMLHLDTLAADEHCALREMREETGLVVTPSQLIWRARYNTRLKPRSYNSFLVACLDRFAASQLRLQLGDEGQNLGCLPISDFLQRPDAILDHQERLADYLKGQSDTAITYTHLSERIAA